MTTAQVRERMAAGQSLHEIEDDADWLDNFEWLAQVPAVREDSGEALYILPIRESVSG